MVECPQCGVKIFDDLHCVFEKNNLLGIFDSRVKAEGYSQALKDRKTKIKSRILNRPIELVSPSIELMNMNMNK